MGLGKQAKTHPHRNRVILLLSVAESPKGQSRYHAAIAAKRAKPAAIEADDERLQRSRGPLRRKSSSEPSAAPAINHPPRAISNAHRKIRG